MMPPLQLKHKMVTAKPATCCSDMLSHMTAVQPEACVLGLPTVANSS